MSEGIYKLPFRCLLCLRWSCSVCQNLPKDKTSELFLAIIRTCLAGIKVNVDDQWPDPKDDHGE